MRPAWRLLLYLFLGLLASGLSGCAGASTAAVAPTTQRRVVNASPRAVSSPLVVSATSGWQATAVASPPPQLRAPSLRLPTERPTADGLQVVLVDGTSGHGVWVRREPAGEPLRIWPDGAPMVVVGEDRDAAGRTWRNVQTLDGETGWVAAEYLFPTDPSALAAGLAAVGDVLEQPPAEDEAGQPGAEEHPADQSASSDMATLAPTIAAPQPALRAAVNPTSSNVGQPAAAATSAPATAAATPTPAPTATPLPTATPAPTQTPLPTATPIRAPVGAISMDAGPTTLTVLGSERGLPIQIGNRPRAGMELLAVQVRVKNREDVPFALYRGSFRLALSDRTQVEPLAGSESPIPYSATIEPGGDLEGWLTFEVPHGVRVDDLTWAPERDVTYALGI